MGPDKDNSLPGDGSFLMGGIFMSNLTTKKECFRRKLFGLPSSQANFVMKIKVGMVLFLFEYEERKLYGVFEATSDGAMDIIPTAFISSGKVFSAQVSFRTIWHCYPLTEAEFYDAIKENYYARNKFHFHLSETQVYKLLHLFYSKKVDAQWQCNKGRKFISQSSHTRKKKFQNFRSGKYEISTESKTDSTMYSDLPGTNLDHSAYEERLLQDADNEVISTDTALYQTVSFAEPPALPDTVNPNSQHVHAFRGNIPFIPQDNPLYQLVPGFHLKKSSIYSGSDNASVNELADYARGSLDSNPFPRHQCYYSPPDQETAFAYSVYESSSCTLPALASKDLRDRVSLINQQDSSLKGFRNRGNITNLQNYHHPSSPRFDDPFTPDIFLRQGTYMDLHRDVTTSGRSPLGTRLLANNGQYASTPQSVDNSRGPRYLRLEPHEIIPHSEYGPSDLKIIESSFYGNPEKASLRLLFDSGPSEYLDEDATSYNLNEDDEYYPVAVSSKCHSDAREKRTSVFLRLSGSRKSPVEQLETHKRLSQLKMAPVEQLETHKSNFGVSLDELIGSLSSRRKYWTKMKELPNFKKPTKVKGIESAPAFRHVYKVSDQFVMSDNVKQEENADELEPESTTLYQREVSHREGGTENGAILPFLNFKRRSETQRMAGETKTSSSIEPRKNEVSLVKHKRRKLLRPSFGEDEVSNKVNDGQEMLDETRELFLKKDDGESNSKDGDMIANDPHEASRCDCGAGGTSPGHLMDQVLFTVSEHVGNVRSSPMSQSDVSKALKLNSEATTFVQSESKFQNMQESSQNFCGGPRDVDGNSRGGSECNASGGMEVEGKTLSLGSQNNNVAYVGQCNFSNLRNTSKIGVSSGGVEYEYVSDGNSSGGERGRGAEYPGDCRGCSCNLEGLPKGHVCQISARAIPDIRTEELFSDQFIGHDENHIARVHLTESSIQITRDPQRNLASTEYENICTKFHFTEFDIGNNNDSQRNWVSSTMVGGRLSSSVCVLGPDEVSRVAEEKTTVTEGNLEFDGNCNKTHESLCSCAEEMGSGESLSDPYIIQSDESADGTTVKSCGKELPCEVANNEIKTSHQPQDCYSECMATGGSLSEPSTVETGNPTVNAEEDHVRLECPNFFVQKNERLIPPGKPQRKQ